MADRVLVGRSNLIILGMGIAACVVLSLMMQHMLKVKQDADIPPIVTELMETFGTRFAEGAEFKIRDGERGKVGEVTIYPLMSTSRRRLVRSVGTYVWRNLEDRAAIDALIVACDDGLGSVTRFECPSPRYLGRSIRELGPDESPFDSGAKRGERRAKLTKAKPKPTTERESSDAPVSRPTEPPTRPK